MPVTQNGNTLPFNKNSSVVDMIQPIWHSVGSSSLKS